MKEFIVAALPWVITGLCVAVLAVHMRRNKGQGKETYVGEGMCFGMCLGVSLNAMIGFDNLGAAMCIGMLVGEVVGMMIPKEDDNQRNK